MKTSGAAGNRILLDEPKSQELALIGAEMQPKSSKLASAINATDRFVLSPLTDSTRVVSTLYGNLKVYALLVTGPKRFFFDIGIFALVPGALILHYASFKPENKKRYLAHFHRALHVFLNSAFLNSSAQNLLFLVAPKGTQESSLLIGVGLIQAGSIAIGIPSGLIDLEMRSGTRYNRAVKFWIMGMRALQMAAIPGFFLDIFNGHLHDSPKWMPTAVGGSLGAMNLIYEIIRNNCMSEKSRIDIFIETVIKNGFFRNLSTASVLYTVTESLYAALHHDDLPTFEFDVATVSAAVLFMLFMAGTIITYVNNRQVNEVPTETSPLLGTINDAGAPQLIEYPEDIFDENSEVYKQAKRERATQEGTGVKAPALVEESKALDSQQVQANKEAFAGLQANSVFSTSPPSSTVTAIANAKIHAFMELTIETVHITQPTATTQFQSTF
jgi:hypothetical protein